MAEEWELTHYTEDGEELFLSSCGKYYTRHAWEHFGDAYRGKVRRPQYNGMIDLNRLPATVDFMADPDGNAWDLSDVHWGTDEITLDMPTSPPPRKP